jgi:hypothetical protein
MIIKPSLPHAHVSAQNMPSQRQYIAELGITRPTEPAPSAASVTISQAARDALALSQHTSTSAPENAIEARLAQIKAKDGMSRSSDDMAFLLANDKKLAAINAKGFDNLTAAELDYVQKTGGFVNTMNNLSTDEKALYDELVAKGDKAAAAAITKIAFIREMGHMAGGPKDTTYDPINTKITAENILNLFKYSIIDPSGAADREFQALAEHLKNKSAATNPA